MDGFFSLFPWGMSGQEIYDNFQNGQGPDRLSAAADTVKELIKNYDNRFNSIKALTVKMESAWQGDASGAAQRGAGPLAVEHALAAPDMNTAQTLVRSQVDVFTASKGAVVKIPPEPKEPGFWDNVLSLGDAQDTYEQKQAEYNAANDHNVTVMSNYEGITDTNTSGMPQSYGRITPDYSAIGVQPQKPPPPPPPPPPVQPRVPTGTGDPNQPKTGTTQPPGTGRPGQPPVGTPNDPPAPSGPPKSPQQTDPGHYLPPGQPGRPGPGPGPGQGQGPYGPGQGFGPGYLPAAGFGPTGGGGGFDSGGRGGGGGTGAGGRGPGGAAGGFAEEGGRGGARGGVGAGAAAAEAAAARGMGGAGGRGGAGGMPMGGGAGKGQGGEDGEHQRPSFLVEADPDETFGTDEVTAPPVIGE